ncbi:MAG: hypothetical protein ACRDTA_26705 [Pseudonocardiaceae bacterium]
MSRIDAIKGQRCANVLTALKPGRQTVALLWPPARSVTGPPDWVTVEALCATMRRGNLRNAAASSAQD